MSQRLSTRPSRGVAWAPWLLVVGTVVADQVSKCAVQAVLDIGQSVAVIPGAVHVTYVQNTGMAFGLFRGSSAVLIVVSIAVSAWLVTELLHRRGSVGRTALGLALVLGGALGNLIDRLRVGFVIDFIDLRVWPVFNLADSAITVGVGVLLWQAVRRGR